jgi:diadenosine tetraphosphate (Ap4A) HIT family hydrolase
VQYQLVIPKFHGEKLTDIPDDSLAELLPVAKKIASAVGVNDFNILQNNGRIAHQLVDHVHGKSYQAQLADDPADLSRVHVIPKPNKEEGLGVEWPMQDPGKDKLQQLFEEIKAKM